MTKEELLDLMKIPHDPQPDWWENSDKRLNEIFHAGDALLCIPKDYGIDTGRLRARYREERPQGEEGLRRLDLPEHAIDKECEITDVSPQKDGTLILMTNPSVRALRDIFCDTQKWKSALIVNARDYQIEQNPNLPENKGIRR